MVQPANKRLVTEAAIETRLTTERLVTEAAIETRLTTDAASRWGAAWASGSTSRLREFFAANTGPRVAITGAPIVGTVTVASQADASALVGKEVQGGVYINTPDLELRDFRIKGDGRYALIDFGPFASRTYIHHIEFDGQQSKDTNAGLGVSSGTGPSDLRVEWNNFHDLNDAAHTRPGSSYKYNFVHDPLVWNTAAWGAYNPAIHPHTDGFQWLRGSGEVVSRNFIEVPYKSVSATPNTNSCLIIKTDVAAIDNVTITENYLNGGTRTVMVNDGGFGLPTNISFDKNRFGPDFNDGIWQYSNASSMVFGSNTWAQTKQVVPTTNGSLGYRSAQPALDPDPLGFGCVMTNLGYGAAATWGAANDARYVRALSGGLINGIEFHVTVSSGNVSVGVYRGRGRGLTHMPYDLVATSGTVACPAAGAARIAIPETWVEPGDYLAMSCDNVTMQLLLFSGTAAPLFRPLGAATAASHPLPASAPSPASPGFRMPILVGTFV
ncbi:MAG: hypothetical protein HOQ27_16495 [Dermatophilaceae bacterium]|nr:hypothetical protein [Dermatophilaceae bacterium]